MLSRLNRTLGIDISLLWPLTILVMVGVYVSLVPQPPHDFWWHLKIGEIIYETREIPSTNLFAWTVPADQPFFYAAWLGELLLYVVYRVGGVSLLQAVRTVLTLVSLWLVGAEGRRLTGSWRYTAPALAAACAMALNNVMIRPQTWSWLPFALFLLLLRRFTDGLLDWKWLLLCPLSMIFWVNAHGAWVLGIVLTGAFAAGEAMTRLLAREQAISWRAIGWLVTVSVLCALAALINPRGIDILRYVRDLMTDPPSQGLVTEWQSPTPMGIANVAFYASILALLLVLAFSDYRLRATDALLLLGFLWLAWSGQRYVVWYGMACMPLLAAALRRLPVCLPPGQSHCRLLNTVLATILLVPAVLAQPWLVEYFPLPPIYWHQVVSDPDVGSLLSTDTPVAAADYLREHPGGQLYHEMAYGSYLIWALPSQKVFVDPRVELYPHEQWLDYLRIGQGIRYNELLDAYGADRLMLSPVHQEELCGLLAEDPVWRKEYEDAHTQIWRRADGIVY